jgi:hypothetical protein
MFLGVPLTVTSFEALVLLACSAGILPLPPVCGSGASGNELALFSEGGCRLALSMVCPLADAQRLSVRMEKSRVPESKASGLKRLKRIRLTKFSVQVPEIGDSKIRI